MKPNDAKSETLQEFVKHYQVCWEVWPQYLMVGSKERQVGFELERSGTPEIGTNHLGPGCPACRQVYSALHAVAEWIFPKEQRPSMYEIAPYEAALRYTKVRGNRPDVILSIKIVHRRGFDQPVDECEMRCLQEMKQHLSELGACERRWSLRMASTA